MSLFPSIPFLSIVCWIPGILKYSHVCVRSVNRNVNVMGAHGPVLRQWESCQNAKRRSGAIRKLTEKVRDFLEGEGYETFTLSTESCDFCERCAYLDGKPCRFPEHMHPCLESYGVVVSEIVEKEAMEYNLGGNTILWFSMVLIRR